MFMFKKLKEIGNGIKNGITKPNQAQSDELHDAMEIDQKDKDLVKRKLRFEEMQNFLDTPHHKRNFFDPEMDLRISEDSFLKALQAEGDEGEKDLKLKRLFKSRAKRLLERAESLTSNCCENLDEEGSLKEEEKEGIKDKKRNKKIVISPKSIKLDISENKEKSLEEKKGDVSKEEKKKSRTEANQLCGIKRSRSFTNKEELESSLKDFTCTICMDYMVGAKKLHCGHCFCTQCISFWFLREKFCPICKERVRDEKNTECNLIDFAIENILFRGSPDFESLKDDLKNWQKRRTQYLEWRKSHSLLNIKIGEKIDVRDTEYIWCTGSVERILKSRYNCADLYFVHYEGWSRCYDEYIPADSDRIAPHSFYTSRNDIPKYTRHDGPDERVYGNVVEGGNDSPRNNRQENNAEGAEQPQNNNEQAQNSNSQPAAEGAEPQQNQEQDEEEKDEEQQQQSQNVAETAPAERPTSARARISINGSSLLENIRRNRHARPQSRRGGRPSGQGLDNLFSDFMGSYDSANPRLGNSILRTFQMRPVSSNLQLFPLSSTNRTSSEGATNTQNVNQSENLTSTAVNEETQLSEIPEEPINGSQEHKNEDEEPSNTQNDER